MKIGVAMAACAILALITYITLNTRESDEGSEFGDVGNEFPAPPGPGMEQLATTQAEVNALREKTRQMELAIRSVTSALSEQHGLGSAAAERAPASLSISQAVPSATLPSGSTSTAPVPARPNHTAFRLAEPAPSATPINFS